MLEPVIRFEKRQNIPLTPTWSLQVIYENRN